MRLRAVVAGVFALAACTQPTTSTAPTTATPPATSPVTTIAPSTTVAPIAVPRIGIRVVDSVGEFYDIESGEKFVPRGVNYVDFYQRPDGSYGDMPLATDTYDRNRVREAFRNLAVRGYNTVRFFLDHCDSGPKCIGLQGGSGLNPGFLDNLVDFMTIAGQEGIYLMLTADVLPSEGGYWDLFFSIFDRDDHFGFAGPENADWLHEAGVTAKEQFWSDLMSGLAERGAPFGTILGWQLTNEFWLHKLPPMTLTEGVVTTANGKTYEVADPEQRRRMVIDGVLHFIDTIRPVIVQHDPEGLVTMGFFVPQFPNPTGVGGDWYVDTAPLVEEANLDFFDFHSYYDWDIEIRKQAENFGMVGHEEKPVVMGETGSGKAFWSAASAVTRGVQWIAESCEVGFDGWLNWGYYPWPDDLEGPPWAFLDADGLLMETMAPVNQPDPCVVPPLEIANVSWTSTASASRSLPEFPPANAIDGTGNAWNSGSEPPQWVAFELAEPVPVGRVGLSVEQWPPGSTHHQIWGALTDGRSVLLADLGRFTTVEMQLGIDFDPPVPELSAIRVWTLETPSGVAWREVEIVSAPQDEPTGCLVRVLPGADFLAAPDPEAAAVPTLGQGDYMAYVEGLLTGSGGSWWRIPGDRWVAVEATVPGAGCEAVAAVDGPAVSRVPVTFEVELPPGTDGEVFIAGFFPDSGIPPWVPYSILLFPTTGDIRSVTVALPAGTTIEYVYTRGTFEAIERPESCGSTDPRTLVVSEGLIVEDSVAKWRDRDC